MTIDNEEYKMVALLQQPTPDGQVCTCITTSEKDSQEIQELLLRWISSKRFTGVPNRSDTH